MLLVRNEIGLWDLVYALQEIHRVGLDVDGVTVDMTVVRRHLEA